MGQTRLRDGAKSNILGPVADLGFMSEAIKAKANANFCAILVYRWATQFSGFRLERSNTHKSLPADDLDKMFEDLSV